MKITQLVKKIFPQKTLAQAGIDLQKAIKDKNLDTVLKILLKYPNIDISNIDVQATNNYGETLLHLAARKENTQDLVEKLLSAEANVNAANKDGWTPLICAVFIDNLKVVEKLLSVESIKADAVTSDGNTALMIATRHGNKEIAQLISNKVKLSIS